MTIHKPVLLRESIEALNLKNDSIVVDATLGGAGHSRAILKIIINGRLIAIDTDKKAINNFEKEAGGRAILVNDNFGNLKNILETLEIEEVDAILADLGWSSDQVGDLERGMSFLTDAPLDMRLDQSQIIIAKEIVNTRSREDLERIIREYGEERFARSIAKKITEVRKEKEIETTLDLVEIIENSVPERYKHQKIHPATRTFQALRIEVNRELENLKGFLPDAIDSLGAGGRLAVISFHSLEDRIVKSIFAENARGCICPPGLPQCVCGRTPKVKIITKKPIVASEEELRVNPRARSAKMRVVEKLEIG